MCFAWILTFAHSIDMAGSFANWCNINGPMAAVWYYANVIAAPIL